MRPLVRISLLGGFSAGSDGQIVSEGAWRLRKAKSLVKLLALAPEHRIHRERASELLWPDRDGPAASNNLHQALYVARRALETAGLDGAAAIELRDDALVLGDAVVDAETRVLYQSILSGSFAAAEGEQPDEEQRARREADPGRGPHNLPLRLTSFVGRERELTEVWRLLDRSRLVTLTGPGGCGKTRLAIEAASGRLRGWPDGVWLVDLAPLADQSLVPDAVAEALGLQLRAGQPGATALAMPPPPRRLLLVLDNCEHLIDSCARLALELLRSCPDLPLLATSREPLHIPGELAWRVPSLSLPEPSDDLTEEEPLRCEAARPFCERAAESAPGFDVGGVNTRAIAATRVRLDGMPLALELAAARARVLTPVQIAERVGDSLQLLAAGSRTALTRQQTLRATLTWSHDLLTGEERALFRRLAVFSGTFALDAAEGICEAEDLDRLQVLDLLDRLVDKSLVAVDHHAGQ